MSFKDSKKGTYKNRGHSAGFAFSHGTYLNPILIVLLLDCLVKDDEVTVSLFVGLSQLLYLKIALLVYLWSGLYFLFANIVTIVVSLAH